MSEDSVLFALRRDFLTLGASTIAACGKVESPTAVEPNEGIPETFFSQILYAYTIRPVRPFNVRVHTSMDLDFVTRHLATVERMTGIPFLFDPNQPVTLDMVGVIPDDPDILNPNGGQYGAVTRLNLRGHVIESARIVWCCDWVMQSPAVLLHEVGHALGFAHCEGSEFIMGAAPISQEDYHPWEKAAWRRLASTPVATNSNAARPQIVCW